MRTYTEYDEGCFVTVHMLSGEKGLCGLPSSQGNHHQGFAVSQLFTCSYMHRK